MIRRWTPFPEIVSCWSELIAEPAIVNWPDEFVVADDPLNSTVRPARACPSNWSTSWPARVTELGGGEDEGTVIVTGIFAEPAVPAEKLT